jgi:hypothetical protein
LATGIIDSMMRSEAGQIPPYCNMLGSMLIQVAPWKDADSDSATTILYVRTLQTDGQREVAELSLQS